MRTFTVQGHQSSQWTLERFALETHSYQNHPVSNFKLTIMVNRQRFSSSQMSESSMPHGSDDQLGVKFDYVWVQHNITHILEAQ